MLARRKIICQTDTETVSHHFIDKLTNEKKKVCFLTFIALATVNSLSLTVIFTATVSRTHSH